MGIPDHLTCLLRNLYSGQEATVRTGHGTTDWFQIGQGVHLGCILSPCLFNFYSEYIMRNAGLEETQAGIKTAERNINKLRYADDTTLMAESEEELKSLLMKVKVEREKVGLKLNIQKAKIMASGPITSWQIDGETGEGNGNPLQCSCLENPRDGEAWCAAISGVAQSRTRLKRLSSSSSSRILHHSSGFMALI